jgi:hypothetical protein
MFLHQEHQSFVVDMVRRALREAIEFIRWVDLAIIELPWDYVN